jgi:pRiA4b ORF-3-like protein
MGADSTRPMYPVAMAIKAAKRASKPKALPHSFVIRATIRDISPKIWRRIEVPDRCTLEQLHRVLQLAFSWLDCHLHAFEVGKRTFRGSDPEWDGEFTSQVQLRELALTNGATIRYNYDFGDDWEVDLVIESVSAREVLPGLLAGERAAPPEDCGGPPGYEMLVEALANPTPGNAELRQWVGSFDPGQFDLRQSDSAVRLMAGWGVI